MRREAARVERWKRIAREAVKQCRRGRIPAIASVGTLEDILLESQHFDERILFWEEARDSLPAAPLANDGIPQKVMIVVGPEGGFSTEEAARAHKQGFRLATLGPRILRAETAAVAACALVQHLYGDLTRAAAMEAEGAQADGASESP
jgi:16S rRNA (uracil1498-N3)-methyltransferase